MSTTNLSPWPAFGVEEADAIRRVLLSGKVNYWTGTECKEFEQEFAEWTGARYAVAVMNGTVALDLALVALGIGPGDEVVVTPRSFFASVSCVVNAGATPVFADVDRESGNLTAATIEEVISPRTKAVICVHLAGWPCDLDPIIALANTRGFFVIEDCAQAHGARYKGRSVGSIGHIGAWSFCQDKILTTGGEGGMVTCNDEQLWGAMWAYKDHGKSYKAVYQYKDKTGFKWLHDRFGTNWRMLEIQAVLGRIQLRHMKEWSALRTANAKVLQQAMMPFSRVNGVVRVPGIVAETHCIYQGIRACGPQIVIAEKTKMQNCSCQHAFYRFYAYVRPENLSTQWNRDRIVEEINRRDIPCFTGTCPEIYLERAFDGTTWRPKNRLPIAKELGETSIVFLVHPTLTKRELLKMEKVITEVLGLARGGY